jgi:hypothetical protein
LIKRLADAAVAEIAGIFASPGEVSPWRRIAGDISLYGYRGMRRSRADWQVLGRGQGRHDPYHRENRQYRQDDITVPGILLGVYALPFFPLGGHCLTPYCTLQYQL